MGPHVHFGKLKVRELRLDSSTSYCSTKASSAGGRACEQRDSEFGIGLFSTPFGVILELLGDQSTTSDWLFHISWAAVHNEIDTD